jgi:hypothetical protein
MRSKLALLLLLVAILALSTMGVSTGPVLADGDDNPLYPLDSFPPTAADNAMLQWNEELLECIRATKPGPTVVARALFVVSAAGYDAWSAYDAKAVPTIRTGFTRRPSNQRTLANKTAAVSYASHRALAYWPRTTRSSPAGPTWTSASRRWA